MRDLFTYINGEWLANHEIPADRGVDGNFYVLRDLSEKRCHELIEADNGRAGTLYRSFMDEDAIEARGLDALAEDFALYEVESVSDLAKALGAGYRYGISAPLGYYITKDSKSVAVKAYLYQAGLSLPDEAYYREEGHREVLEKFRAHLERMIGLGKLDEDPAGAADRILALETDIARGHWTVTESRDALKTFNPVEFEELPGIIQELLAASGLPKTGVVNGMPSYVDHLVELLTEERLEDWKLWAKWQVLRNRAGVLPAEISKANFDFYGTVLQGSTEQRARWKRGVSLTEGAVAEEIGKLYVEKYFPASHKDAMLELVDYLIKAYDDRISHLTWMSELTRRKALEKLGKFEPKIGYPDKWRDFSGLEFGADLMANVRAAAAFNHDHEVAKVGKPADRDEWFCPPQMVNAFYNPVMNSITFPAAILQPPFFDPDASPAANFGGIGAVIGHEIGHGFDDQGSQYDGEGNLNSWWTDEDRAGFEKLTSKLVDQFQGLVPTVIKEQGQENPPVVNGAFTLGENIGDLGGLGIAIVALGKYLGREPEVKELQELFFSWARVWRTKIRPQLAAQYLAMDPHSPAEFRCNVIAGNIPEFYKAFDVDPEGPCFVAEDKRVTIW
ncbi:MAG: M13-type metalloendopeptidase [Corynebacterium sp.]|nr:M13-type metalloendopeptidase [Corynebacterium sp.]